MKELNLEQMENIQGVVSAAEYCATIRMIYDNNPDEKGSEGINFAMSLCNGLGQ